MGDIVSLKLQRKKPKGQRAANARPTAAANRAKFGRTKDEHKKSKAEAEAEPPSAPCSMATSASERMTSDRKRSLTIAGHRTSVSLEPEFWEALTDLASRAARAWPNWWARSIPAAAPATCRAPSACGCLEAYCEGDASCCDGGNRQRLHPAVDGHRGSPAFRAWVSACGCGARFESPIAPGA